MTVDDVIRCEIEAEAAIERILRDLQYKTGRRVEWVKVEARDLDVTINTVSMTLAEAVTATADQPVK